MLGRQEQAMSCSKGGRSRRKPAPLLPYSALAGRKKRVQVVGSGCQSGRKTDHYRWGRRHDRHISMASNMCSEVRIDECW